MIPILTDEAEPRKVKSLRGATQQIAELDSRPDAVGSTTSCAPPPSFLLSKNNKSSGYL